jgi:lipopolysaccharide export LptBFGC system permease protein LptF
MSAQSLPMSTLFEFMWYQIPRIVQYALPMSVLFGTVQTFSDLSARGEMTALWAGGMSLKRMLRAPLLWGCILAAFVFSAAGVSGARRRNQNQRVAQPEGR